MRNSHFNDEVFSVVGAHNQQVFACSNEEKTKTTKEGVCSSPISMVGIDRH
jgi:hypothetical protein